MPMFYRKCKQFKKGNLTEKETETYLSYSVIVVILGMLTKIFFF